MAISISVLKKSPSFCTGKYNFPIHMFHMANTAILNIDSHHYTRVSYLAYMVTHNGVGLLEPKNLLKS